ncbi:MAG TPA: DUF302 domain-containing protein [Chloroflexota bacterium]|nr:DUF302 domain-containing protein [Chloroflexota bacterium]
MRARVPYPHADAIARVKDALKSEGFGVLTEIDVQRTMKEKLGHEMGRYVILGACNPPLAHRGLTAEQELGALLPCNVIVYEDRDAGGATVVSAQDPQPMLTMVGNPALAPVAEEARARLSRVLAALGGEPG